jgi:hypothetical protein
VRGMKLRTFTSTSTTDRNLGTSMADVHGHPSLIPPGHKE